MADEDAGHAEWRGHEEPTKVSRKHVVDLLRRAGYPDRADEARRVLPDPVDLDDVLRWAGQLGMTRDELISAIGGSP